MFLVNAAVALLDPGGFIALMRSSFLGAFVSNFTPFVWLIAANDLILGILLYGTAGAATCAPGLGSGFWP